MRVSCEIKSRDIIPGDMARSRRYMSDKSSAFAAVLVEHKADNVHVAINPDEGFLMSFECGISEAAQIFEKLKLAALR